MGLAIWPALPSVASAAADLAQQRQWFEQARQALKDGDDERFASLKKRLKDYPLYPYLEIWQARADLKLGLDAEVEQVLATHARIPESLDLRLEWIRNLAERGQWPHVADQMARMPGIARSMPEIAVVALWRTGREQEALQQFGRRWQQGAMSGDLAWRVERAWRQAGHPTAEEIAARIVSLGRAGRWQAVAELIAGDKGFGWVQAWRALREHPEGLTGAWPSGVPARVRLRVFEDVLQRLARKDVELAWQALDRHRALAGKKRHELAKRIALRAARRHDPQALRWLESLPRAVQDADTRAWRARLLLLAGDDRGLLKAVQAMPEKERSQSRWRFWQARALLHLGQKKQAERMLRELAADRGYYSFLAAEQLGLPYSFAAVEFEADPDLVRRLEQLPAMRRAAEWWMLDDAARANREWYLAMAGADAESWKAAAALALQRQWYDRMIYAAWRAGERDALSLRFPRGYAKSVHRHAADAGLDASLIWSVIRQESAFNRRAVSRSGARGLMQLMPATARHVASRHALHVRSDDLFEPETNIRLGSLYLAELNERFDGNVALMAAAYNAGPSRVDRWMQKTPFVHREAWIEAIPFDETRRYVQQVLAFIVVYDWLQSREPTPMSNYLASSTAADASLKPAASGKDEAALLN